MSTFYKFNDKQFIFREEGDLALLLDKRTNAFYNLNSTAREILKGVQGGLSSASIITRIIRRYDASSDVILRDFNEFERHLREGGVISADNSSEVGYSELYSPDMYKPIRLEEAHFIERNLPKEKSRILDLGCGRGHYANRFGKNHNVIGVDVSTEALQKAKDFGNVVAGDVSCLPIKNNYADVILLTGHVIGYLTYDRRRYALESIYNTLCTGGNLVIAIWTEDVVPVKGKDLVDVKDLQGNPNRLHFFTNQEINGMLHDYALIEDALFLNRDGEFGNEYLVYCCKK